MKAIIHHSHRTTEITYYKVLVETNSKKFMMNVKCEDGCMTDFITSGQSDGWNKLSNDEKDSIREVLTERFSYGG